MNEWINGSINETMDESMNIWKENKWTSRYIRLRNKINK